MVDEGYELVGSVCDSVDADACLDDTLVCGPPDALAQDVEWVDGVNVSIVGDSIAESGSDGNYMTDDSYAHGLEPIWADGFFEFQFGQGESGFCGLSAQPTVNPNKGLVMDSMTSVEFAFEVGKSSVFVNGTSVATLNEWWASDTVYRIERVGSTLVFSVGYAGAELEVLWTQNSFVPDGPLYPDVALYKANSNVTEAYIWQPYVCEDAGDQEFVELCNGLDEDCDGEFDEGFVTETLGAPEDEDSEIGEPCGVGECVGGTVVCDSETATTCSSYDQATDELCNGLDDDCDGETDENGACPTAIQVSAGEDFTCALLSDETIRCWGISPTGQLGPGIAANGSSTTGVEVPLPGDNGATHIVTGNHHACARTTLGHVYCWGEGSQGQLGKDVAAGWSANPLMVLKDGFLTTISIAAGGNRTCAITTSNKVVCWGEAVAGELGPEVNAATGPPTTITYTAGGDELSNMMEVTVGQHHVCSRWSGQKVYCWGSNSLGQLGAGSDNAALSIPTTVKNSNGGEIDAQALSAGTFFTCAMDDGEVMCWGFDGEGQLGDNAVQTNGYAIHAVRVIDGETNLALSGVEAISSGSKHACAILDGGAVRCWGSNMDSEAGQVLEPSYDVAQPALPLDAPAVTVSAGGQHTCVSDEDGKAQCWGSNYVGQLGNGLVHESDILEPVVVQGLDNLTTAMGVGAQFSCALAAGQIRCWGANTNGQLGNDAHETMIHAKPYEPVQLSGGVPMEAWWSDLSANDNFACGIGGIEDQVYCWGEGTSGQVGDPNQSYLNSVAVPIPDIGGAQTIATGQDHACATLKDWTGADTNAIPDGVYCWGDNTYGQLGDGGGEDAGPWPNLKEIVPVFATGTEGVTNVATGARHSCALVGNKVRCWGSNAKGQLGGGQVGGQDDIGATAVTVMIYSELALTEMDLLTAGAKFNCAAKSGTRDVFCWGSNSHGQNGTGIGDDQTPLAVQLSADNLEAAVTHLTAGSQHACVATADGSISCWGSNGNGQLGIGSQLDKEVPTKVEAIAAPDGQGVTIHALQAGPANTCAMVEGVHPGAGMEMMCWGKNGAAQVGNGAYSSATPTIVDLGL